MNERNDQDGGGNGEKQCVPTPHTANEDENVTRPAAPNMNLLADAPPAGMALPSLPIAKILAQMGCADAPVKDPQQRQVIARLGYTLRCWRMQHALTRQTLAARLALEPDQLLCLEHIFLQPVVIPRGPLADLAQELGNSDAEQALAAAITDYLALPSS